VQATFEAQWREPGFTVPNPTAYPWQWLWDSCFHAVVWTALGRPDRALVELGSVFAHQDPSGFVPHVTYWGEPGAAEHFWGRPMTSSITQPPLYGHALAVLARAGVVLPDDLLRAARRGLRHLLVDRPRIDGLVPIVHPWESGCDDSPRWDHWCPGGWSIDRWYDVKGVLVTLVERDVAGVPVRSDAFRVGPVGFNALVAWNIRELLDAVEPAPGDDLLVTGADELTDVLASRWDPLGTTWIDTGDAAATSGGVRTADGLLPVLVESRAEVRALAFEALADSAGLGAPFGPRGVDRREPGYLARTYWRGPAWPQLSYLFWCAARIHHESARATALADAMLGGVIRSGLGEYWDADSGAGLGASPQGWAGLVVPMLATVP
jgi:hypothetical protein